MTIGRYGKTSQVSTTQDPFSVCLDLLGFLGARDYVTDLLKRKHGLTHDEAKARTRKIVPHVNIARSYVQQAMESPADIGFLPAYYGILNLMKVYVLLGPRHADLDKHRWHGATYDVQAKDSQSILTEEIVLKRGGVFPLFYETIVGQGLPSADLCVKLRDILPYIPMVSYEYELAVGRRSRMCYLSLQYESQNGKTVPVLTPNSAVYGKERPAPSLAKKDLKVLGEFTKHPSRANTFQGRPLDPGSDREASVRDQLNPHLLYRLYPNAFVTPISSRRMQMPEEFPLALVFFYMSSVVRYKPEFLSRVKDSKYWPLLSSIYSHGLLSFVLAFWSFMQQENYYME